MSRLPACRHAAPALAVALLSLLVPFMAQGGPVSAEAVSVTARAAQHTVTPGDQAFPVDGPLFASAQRLAAEYWGATACDGEVAIRWATMDRGTNATASWRNPSDAWNNADENFDCVVELNTQAGYTFPKLCTVLAHELGHLLGNPHADADGQLMSAVYSSPLPACESAAPAPPAPAAAPVAVTQRVAAPVAKPAAKVVVTKTATKRTRALRKTTRRCVWRFSDGKRTKRCVVVKKRTAAKKPAARVRR